MAHGKGNHGHPHAKKAQDGVKIETYYADVKSLPKEERDRRTAEQRARLNEATKRYSDAERAARSPLNSPLFTPDPTKPARDMAQAADDVTEARHRLTAREEGHVSRTYRDGRRVPGYGNFTYDAPTKANVNGPGGTVRHDDSFHKKPKKK